MLIGEKIKRAIEKSGMDVPQVANALDMSPQNLYKIFKKDSCESKYLQKLSDLFKLPMKYFFEDNWELSMVNSSMMVADDVHGYQIQKNRVRTGTKDECEKELAAALATIQQMELRIRDKDETITLLKDRK